MQNKRKNTKYLWCTLTIGIIAACTVFVYVKNTTGTKNTSSYQNSKHYASSPEKLVEEQCIPVCETKECVYLSKVLLDHINPDVSPCEDFHKFACGRKYEKFDDDVSYTLTDQFEAELHTKVKYLLDNIEAKPGSASEKLKAVYNSCMEYSSNEFQAVPTVLKLLDNLGIQGWPYLASNFRFVNPNITKVLSNFLLYAEYAFVDLQTKQEYWDLDEETMYDAKVEAFVLCPKSMYEKQDKPTRKYLVNRIFQYFKLDAAAINDIWKELEGIHDALVNLREESKNIPKKYENRTTIFMVCDEETIDWEHMCETLKFLVEATETSDKVSDEYASIMTENTVFLKKIFPLLSEFTDRSIANYLALNVFLNNLKQLNSYFHLSPINEDRHLGLGKFPTLRWQKCVAWITENMNVALAHEYFKEDFTLEMLNNVRDLGEEGIKLAADLVMEQDWLKVDDYKQLVHKKMASIKLNFDHYFDMLPNETKVNKFYELIQYHPTNDSFLQNVFEYKKSMRTIEFNGLFQTKQWVWKRKLFMVNAFGGEGKVGLSLGLLLPPNYFFGADRIMNVVSASGTILHEVGHNFDEILSKDISRIDPEGNEAFEEKKKCMVDQFSQFKTGSSGRNLNGSQYIDENFADVFRTSLVDKLIEKYINTSKLLPSVPYSLEQQLYIYSANLYCEVFTKEIEDYYEAKETHALNKFRLLGTAQNSKGFAEAFGCPLGSYLNPVTKCSILE